MRKVSHPDVTIKSVYPWNTVRLIQGIWYYCGMPVKKFVDKKGYYWAHGLFIEGENTVNTWFDIIGLLNFKLGEICVSKADAEIIQKPKHNVLHNKEV